jgi:hypothetical protein
MLLYPHRKGEELPIPCADTDKKTMANMHINFIVRVYRFFF